MKTNAILSLHYAPNSDWFRVFLNEDASIDIGEHYLKQTYRNRCVILSANGPLSLTIPVKKTGSRQAVKRVEIEYAFDWQKQHWEAIRSAYGNAPYFLHYRDKFENLFRSKPVLLIEWNLNFIKTMLDCCRVVKSLTLTESYQEMVENDYRDSIHPKKAPIYPTPSYLQVFAARFPFQQNLSMLDALFNLGPDCLDRLRP